MLTSRNSTTSQQVPDPSKFPDGMAALADEIHTMGFKLGIYRYDSMMRFNFGTHSFIVMLGPLHVQAFLADLDTRPSTLPRTIHGASTVSPWSIRYRIN